MASSKILISKLEKLEDGERHSCYIACWCHGGENVQKACHYLEEDMDLEDSLQLLKAV